MFVEEELFVEWDFINEMFQVSILIGKTFFHKTKVFI